MAASILALMLAMLCRVFVAGYSTDVHIELNPGSKITTSAWQAEVVRL